MKAFTRRRKLPLPHVVTMLLRKSARSLQNRLNEFILRLEEAAEPVTASAFSQARQKLRHSAFIELNERGVVEPFYRDGDYARERGLRVLAIDSTRLRLPESDEIVAHFGRHQFSTRGELSAMPMAVLTVLHDVLSGIGHAAALGAASADEKQMGFALLEKTRPGDVVLYDAGFPSYRLIGEHFQRGVDFVLASGLNGFDVARRMLRHEIREDDVLVAITPQAKQASLIEHLGLARSYTVRCIRMPLLAPDRQRRRAKRRPVREEMILVSSLVDRSLYPGAWIRSLYAKRWGVETAFYRLKEHLEVEQFTGMTTEAVYQDVYASLLLVSLEAVLSLEVEQQWSEAGQADRQVNRQVSYHAIREQVVAVMLSPEPSEGIVEELMRLFGMKPMPVRERRHNPRPNKSDHRRWLYQKYQRRRSF